MKHLYLVIFTTIILSASCGNSPGNSDPSTSRPTDSTAVDAGQQQARLMVEADPDTAAMRRILLDTRAAETKLRQQGLNNSADDYIQAFEDYIRSASPTLTRDLGL